MDGVIILNSYEILTNASEIFFIFVWGFVFAVLALSLLYLFAMDTSSIFTVIVAIVMGALAVILFCNIPEKKYETRYQVTIDDSVSMNEFQSKYEILDVEGKIYTIIEREDLKCDFSLKMKSK